MRIGKILITGASSGLGAALARAYARDGATLALWGRDAGRLAASADACRAMGAVCETECFDLADLDSMLARLTACDDRAPIDLAIFCAGLGGSVRRGQVAESPESARAIAEVNFTGPVMGASWLAGAMAKRGRGQIVLIGSIAESFPLPMAPTYAASKAGLAMFAEALATRMAAYNVTVTLVSPGFIDTPMSQGLTQPKPFLMDADKAARIIARKIARGADRIVLPWQFKPIRFIARLLPRALLRHILRRA